MPKKFLIADNALGLSLGMGWIGDGSSQRSQRCLECLGGFCTSSEATGNGFNPEMGSLFLGAVPRLQRTFTVGRGVRIFYVFLVVAGIFYIKITHVL